jgi:hypothetical protein
MAHISSKNQSGLFTWIKLGGPVLLFVMVWLTAVPIRDWTALVWYAIFPIPLAAGALWMALVLVQVRAAPTGLIYRRWIRWHNLQASAVEDVYPAFVVLGAVRLVSGLRLFFVVEPENRELVKGGWAIHARRVSTREKWPVQTIMPPFIPQDALWALAGAAGWLTLRAISAFVPTPLRAESNRPVAQAWFSTITNFEGRHGGVLALVVIAFAGSSLWFDRPVGIIRRGALVVIGVCVALIMFS